MGETKIVVTSLNPQTLAVSRVCEVTKVFFENSKQYMEKTYTCKIIGIGKLIKKKKQKNIYNPK